MEMKLLLRKKAKEASVQLYWAEHTFIYSTSQTRDLAEHAF
jgi:hypothetical protein